MKQTKDSYDIDPLSRKNQTGGPTKRTVIKRRESRSTTKLWDYEKEIRHIRSRCPSYHCRTGQLRPDRIERVLIGTALCIFCSEELRRTLESWFGA